MAPVRVRVPLPCLTIEPVPVMRPMIELLPLSVPVVNTTSTPLRLMVPELLVVFPVLMKVLSVSLPLSWSVVKR